MDRYEIGLDVSKTEPAEAITTCDLWLGAMVEVAAGNVKEMYPTRNVYVFDRFASWRQVQTWHYVGGELVPISWRS